MSKPKTVSSLLTFQVGRFRFCVDAVDAEAIIEAPEINSVPMAPKSIAGIFSYRSSVAVVVHLRRKFGLPDPLKKSSGQIILTRIDEELKGFLVDEVLDILENTELNWQALPVLGTSSIASHTVLKDDDIFLYTDFDRLFKASDSEDYSSFLTAAAGGRQTDKPSMAHPDPEEKADRKTEDTQVTMGEDLQTGNRESPVKEAATLDQRNDRRKPPANSNGSKDSALYRTGANKSEPEADRFKHRGRILNSPRKRTAAAKPPVGHRPPTGNQSLFRPAAGRHNPQYPSAAHRRSPAEIDQYHRRNHRGRQEKPATLWPKLAAGLLFFVVIAGLSAWFWPQDSLSLESYTPAQETENVIASVEAPQAEIPAVVKDSSHRKPTFATSAKSSDSIKKDSFTAHSAVGNEKATARESDSTAETTASDEMVSLPVDDPAPEPAPATGGQSREILRVDTEDFTLTVERPEPSLKKEAANETPAKWTTDEFVHIVVRGDTLWDIAEHYLGDPFRYPDLAKVSHIKDPHWIYPGDVIRIVRKNKLPVTISQH